MVTVLCGCVSRPPPTRITQDAVVIDEIKEFDDDDEEEDDIKEFDYDDLMG
jgi:hypothetical protein